MKTYIVGKRAYRDTILESMGAGLPSPVGQPWCYVWE